MDYELLLDLPVINGITLIGDLSLEQLGLVPMTSSDISAMITEVLGYQI